MNDLYNSSRFTLIDAEETGKKITPSRLYFRGLPSVLGDGTVVKALQSGVVVFAGREYNVKVREARYHTHVIVRGKDNVCICYANLDSHSVQEGEHILAGTPIGKCSKVLLVELRRNERRIDAYEVLGLPRRYPQNIDYTRDVDDVEIVCEVLQISDSLRLYINSHPHCEPFWTAAARIVGELGDGLA